MTDKKQDESRKTRKSLAPAAASEKEDARIAKVMARAGLCSRREAETWIAEGRVSVNGVALTSPAFNVGPRDKIIVDGKLLGGRERTRLFMFNKPRDLVTTNADPDGRPTIFGVLPPELPRLMAIGRLDINTEGLLLLTNDGGLARVLELPKTGWLRRYRVRANGQTDQARLDELRNGVTIDGEDYAGIEATLDRVQGANVWLTMGLREGKNREIKRVLEHIGLYVNRLIRISYGPFQLGDLGDGALEEVPGRVLRDQLGEALSAEAGVDFEAPVLNPLMNPQERAAFVEAQREAFKRNDQARRAAGTRHGSAAREDETRVERIKPTPRKHVSAIRAKRGAETDGARQRIERGATADRKGRAVKVERLSAVGAPKGEVKSNRNARRFEEEQRRTLRQDAATFGERRVRPPKEEEADGFKPRKRFDRRNAEGERFSDRREPREGAGGKGFGRPPRERSGKPPGRSAEGRTFEKKSFEKKPFEKRSSSGKSFDKRDGERSGRAPGRSSEGRSFDKKPFAGRSSEGRSYEKKPFEKKSSGGRSSGKSSERPRGGGGKPSSGAKGPRKSGGDKPFFRKGPR